MSPSFARPRRFWSFIEPDMSTTSSTFAGLRSSRQVLRMRSSTRGSGRPSTRSGWAGSTPFSFVTRPAGLAFRSAGRNPHRPAASASISSARNSWNAFAPSRSAVVLYSASIVMNGLSE